MLDNLSAKDELFAALQHLKHRKHEVILFHVHDKKNEIDFEFENRPYEFIDLETDRRVKLRPSDVKELYLEKTKAAKEELKLKCGQYKIDLVETDINKDFSDVLLSYLVKRSKLY